MGSFGDADKGLASYPRVAQALRGTAPSDILPAAFAKLAAGMNPTDVRFWGEIRTCAAASSQSPPSLSTQSSSEQAISCRDHLFRIHNIVLRIFFVV